MLFRSSASCVRTEKRIDGPTPNGGVYSVARYFDEDGNPVDESVGPVVVITEYDRNDRSVFRTYGRMSPSASGKEVGTDYVFKSEIGMFPLWQYVGDELVNLDPERFPVDAVLRDRIIAWDTIFQATYDMEDPGNSRGFATAADEARFVAEGREILDLLRRLLGPGAVRSNFDGPTR